MIFAILILTVTCFACKGQDTKDNSDAKSKNIKNELVGAWRSDVNDEVTRNSIGNVTMTFTADGNLVYDIYEGDKLQRMNMTYHISGDAIVSDQPSHPQEQKTKYKLENNDRLILEFEGVKTVFIKVKK